MRNLLVAVVAVSLAAPVAAEYSPFQALPGAAAVRKLVGLDASKAEFKAAKAGEEAEQKAVTGRQSVGIDVRNFSGGDITIWAPFIGNGIDVRLYKPFQRDGDYNITGTVDRESFTGQAYERFRGDPQSGYNISGFGFSAWLDRAGRDWRLSGSADVKDARGQKRRVSFNFYFDRVWADASEWRVSTFGLDASIRANSWSARIDGTYDPEQMGTMPLAVLSMAAGLINQERLRQEPRRP